VRPGGESLRERVARAVSERVEVVDYDPRWPSMFAGEKEHLTRCLPSDLVGRIEHFGSTAVPGLAAKPVIDMLVEVVDLGETRRRIAPLLESRGYDYFWRPTSGDSTPPFYAWFIKRDESGARTHHIHMVESHFEHWNGLLFRDWLRDHPEDAARYGRLKRELAGRYGNDRVAYTRAKGAFISKIMKRTGGGGKRC